MPDHGTDKKEAILDTALTLFTERGFFGTPTSLISKEAGVATGTLFFYFKTKEDLIDTLYRRTKSEAAQAMFMGLGEEMSVKAKFHRLGSNAVDWGIRHPREMKFMEQFAHSPFVSTNAQEEGMSHFLFLEALVNEGIREGTIRNLNPSLLFCMMASALSGLIAHISLTDDPATREEITGQGLQFIWNGLQAGSGSGKKRSRKPAGKK